MVCISVFNTVSVLFPVISDGLSYCSVNAAVWLVCAVCTCISDFISEISVDFSVISVFAVFVSKADVVSVINSVSVSVKIAVSVVISAVSDIFGWKNSSSEAGITTGVNDKSEESSETWRQPAAQSERTTKNEITKSLKRYCILTSFPVRTNS